MYFKYNCLLFTCTSSTIFSEYFYLYLSSFFLSYWYFYSSTPIVYFYQLWNTCMQKWVTTCIYFVNANLLSFINMDITRFAYKLFIHPYIHTCMHTYIHACMHACMHAWMHACMTHARTHARTYIHTIGVFLASDSWRLLSANSSPPARFASVSGSTDGYFYVSTGEGAGGEFIDDIWKLSYT